MINSAFLGHRPSSYKVNPIVRAFIVSEMFFWSGWNLINPIFAIFIAQNISGGSIEAAGTAVTIYLISRIIVELIASRLFNQITDQARFIISVLGIIVIGITYFGYCIATNFVGILIIQVIIGVGFGIVSPAKLALFSEHLDKGKESSEWGLYDGITLSGMALTATLGGYIAQKYGFNTLFIISAITIWIGAIPFCVFYIKNRRNLIKQ